MENNRKVTRFLLSLFGVLLGIPLAVGIWLREWSFLLCVVMAFAALFTMLLAVSFINYVLFAPLLSLLGRFMGKNIGIGKLLFNSFVRWRR